MALTKDDWAAVVAAHYEAIYLFALRLLGAPEEARDATQDAFLKAFSAVQPGWQPDRIRPLLFTIARNCCLDRRRWWKRWGRLLGSLTLEQQRDAKEPALELRFLRELSKGQREVLVLRHFHGFDTRETAEILGISEGTVKSQLKRAIAAARIALFKDE